MAQLSYGYVTPQGVAGGIFDAYHYMVDSRINEEENGVMGLGMGVVKGTDEGKQIKLPVSASDAEDFEGITVNGFTTQLDLEGIMTLDKTASVGVMHLGRIWAQIDDEQTYAYGDPLYLIISGDNVGKFSNVSTGNIQINGRFIGAKDNGIAPVELFGWEKAGAGD